MSELIGARSDSLFLKGNFSFGVARTLSALVAFTHHLGLKYRQSMAEFCPGFGAESPVKWSDLE
jgi:hypothetical protein